MGIVGEPRIGVTVQLMVEAETAGVLFHAQPGDRRGRAVDRSIVGVGLEVVVSGLVVPDSYRISADGVVLERIPGEKDVALQSK